MDNSGPYNHIYGGYPYDHRYTPPPVYPPPPNQPYPPPNPSPYALFPNQPYPPPIPAGYTSNFSHVSYGYPVQDPLLPILPSPSHDNNNNSSSSHSDQYTSPYSAPVLHHQSGFHRHSSKPHHSQSLSENDSRTLELPNFTYNPVDSASTTSERDWEDGDKNTNDLVPIYPPVYPPIDNLNNLHLLENSQPRPESSSSLPSTAAAKASSSATLRHSFGTKYDKKYDTPECIDSGGNRLSLSSWESANSGPISIPFVRPVLSHSVSFPHSGYGQNFKTVPAGQNSSGALLLHGNLDIWVFGARNLPNMDMFHKTIGDVFQKLPGNVSNRIEGTMSHKITSDPYVSITIAGAVIGRTFVISNSENPLWQQHFCVPVAHNASVLQFFVKDSDVVGSQLIGIVSISVEKIVSGAKIHGFYPILNTNKKLCKAGASLNLSVKYTPSKQVKMYHLGVGPGPDYFGVPDTYFPLRKGGKLTLYQDAHVPNGGLPVVSLDNGTDYVHGKCWYDIFSAISQARRLIYITGWSVWHKVRLIRDGGTASRYSLGDLLRMRSQEGVRVLLLIWDDPTSRSILGYKTDGVMQTHDEETRRFFKHSSVQVILSPRMAGKRHSWAKQKEVGTIYTHHQKTVVVDADAGNNTRRIVAFVGGLDLCDGRYDTPRHPIFSTLQTVHRDDYHNPTYTGSAVGCPREPWHDLHCKIDGPAAYDVLTNFEQRWLNASTVHGIKKLKKSDDALLRIDRLPDIMGQSDAPCLGEDDPESWHVQIFRSIDSNSVKGFPKNPKDGTSQNLVCGKNVLIDMSIHAAYVKAIRSAQRFIYIENQYFLGSSYNWSSNKELGANNLIPMEIALKIAEKIRANQRFATYIVIPMWPEGNPTGAATQRILFWQHKTMQMMYEIIYKALLEVGLESAHHPLDYLNFFCLGNREAANFSNVPVIDHSNTTNSPQALTQKNRRFMIYVHSKGMIVDDEYVIIGSANINQRSLEGTRDTEIAMGAYQPHHTSAREPPSPLGQVYGYRMSLMAEHLGIVEDCFMEPESLKCVHRVRQLSEMNWEQFSGEKIMPMNGHLMKYPVEVDRCGRVTPLPGHENFPDVGGKIIGSFLAIQENLTI